MPAVTHYLGRPAGFWVEVMSGRARAERRRMQGVASSPAARPSPARAGHETGSDQPAAHPQGAEGSASLIPGPASAGPAQSR
jgi:hypothetical protein